MVSHKYKEYGGTSFDIMTSVLCVGMLFMDALALAESLIEHGTPNIVPLLVAIAACAAIRSLLARGVSPIATTLTTSVICLVQGWLEYRQNVSCFLLLVAFVGCSTFGAFIAALNYLFDGKKPNLSLPIGSSSKYDLVKECSVYIICGVLALSCVPCFLSDADNMSLQGHVAISSDDTFVVVGKDSEKGGHWKLRFKDDAKGYDDDYVHVSEQDFERYNVGDVLDANTYANIIGKDDDVRSPSDMPNRQPHVWRGLAFVVLCVLGCCLIHAFANANFMLSTVLGIGLGIVLVQYVLFASVAGTTLVAMLDSLTLNFIFGSFFGLGMYATIDSTR